MSDETTLIIKKDTLWKYSTFLLLALLIVGGFVFFFGEKNNPTIGNVVEHFNFPKSKVSRILDRLEQTGIIERKRRGMTNIIFLK